MLAMLVLYDSGVCPAVWVLNSLVPHGPVNRDGGTLACRAGEERFLHSSTGCLNRPLPIIAPTEKYLLSSYYLHLPLELSYAYLHGTSCK